MRVAAAGSALLVMAIAACALATVDAGSGLLGRMRPALDPGGAAPGAGLPGRAAALQKLRTHPIDGGAIRQLGDAAAAAGDVQVSQAYYQLAIRRAPRDVLARRQVIAHAVAEARYSDAATHMDALLRVDPQGGQALLLQYPGLLRREDFRAVLVARLAGDPPWRAGLVDILTALADPAAAQALLAQLAAVSAPRADENALRATLLVKLARPLQARSIWAQGLPAEARRCVGLVFDGGFEYPHAAKPYGWQMQSEPGVAVGFDTAHAGEGRSSLLLLFDGRAADFSGIAQDVVLPTGSYRLTLQVQAELPPTARPFAWTVACHSAGEELARLVLPARTQGWQTVATDFVVPPQCTSQQLKLSRLARNLSERQVSGRLAVDSVAIRPLPVKAATRAD